MCTFFIWFSSDIRHTDLSDKAGDGVLAERTFGLEVIGQVPAIAVFHNKEYMCACFLNILKDDACMF